MWLLLTTVRLKIINWIQVDSDNVFKHLSMAFSFVSSLILVPLFYGNIWLEKYGSDNRRTWINKLTSSLFWTCIAMFLVTQNVYTVRFVLGPLPSTLCFWFITLRKCLTVNCLLLVNSITLSRYVFIFWLKNPAAFKDDFWSVYISALTVLLSFISQLPRMLVPGTNTIKLFSLMVRC